MKLLKWIRDNRKRRLPTNLPSFNLWLDAVIECSGLPDNTSTRQLAATFIMHTPPTVTRLSIKHIADQLCRAASYQTAKAVLNGNTNDPRDQQQAGLKAVPNESTTTTKTSE